jgi:hypothetical protein
MKKFLLSLMLIGSLGITKLHAQCTLSNVSVSLNSATATTKVINGVSVSGCQVNLNLAFDLAQNNGNKYIWINLWKSTDYNFITPNPYTNDGPTLDQLDGADNTHDPVAVIGINNNTPPVSYLTNYTSDPTNITPVIGTSISNTPSGGVNHFILNGISFFVPGSCAGLVLQGDVWSSNANSGAPHIHCYSQGISFFGDPTIEGEVFCTDPATYQVILRTVSNAPLTGTYKVYKDFGVVGVYEPGTDVLLYSSGTVNYSASSPYSSPFLPYPSPSNKYLLVELTTTAPFSKVTYGNLNHSCIGLPVTFKSFKADRKSSSSVGVTWTTASEQNNKGFFVQRNDGSGWKNVAFVFSASNNGNSSTDLSYSFNDVNTETAISQYRVQQVDLDGMARYSTIAAVRGLGTSAKLLVYPNPSANGNVNVVFDDNNSVRDVQVSDAAGRTIKHFKSITNNLLLIENLKSGFYTIKVTNRNTAATTVEKVVVK